MLTPILFLVPFFKGKIPQFIADCITAFQPMVFQDGDFIIKEGSAADEMYFLIKGRASVYYGGKKQVTIVEGAYFGEIGCIMGGIRRAGIKAITVCELQALSRRNLNSLLGEYPDVGEELKRVAKERVRTVKSSSAVQKQVANVRKMLKEREREKFKLLGGITEDEGGEEGGEEGGGDEEGEEEDYNFNTKQQQKLTKDMTKALTRSTREKSSDALPGTVGSDDEDSTAQKSPQRSMQQKSMSLRSTNGLAKKQMSYRSAHMPMREMSMTSGFGEQGSGAGGMRGTEFGMQNWNASGGASGGGGGGAQPTTTNNSNSSSVTFSAGGSEGGGGGESGGEMSEIGNLVDMHVHDAAALAKQTLESKMEEITRAFIVARRTSVPSVGNAGAGE